MDYLWCHSCVVIGWLAVLYTYYQLTSICVKPMFCGWCASGMACEWTHSPEHSTIYDCPYVWMDFPPGSFYVHFSIGLVCILFRRTGCPCAAFTLLRVPLVVMLLPQFPHCIPPFCGLYSLLLWIIAVFLEPRGLYASERSIYPLANVFTQKPLLAP